MKVFVTGGTGFSGSRVVPLLLTSGYQLRCLYRATTDRSILPQPGIEWAQGDLADWESLSAGMRGADALVNIASLGFGHADSILKAATAAGIQRAIFISTTAIFTQLNADSKKVRVAAELAIEASSLKYTILRPTMIYGSDRDRNISRLIRWLRDWPLFPVFGDGNYLQQPIHVDDVAQAIISCLAAENTIRKSYNIAGRRSLTYNQVIDTIAKQLNISVWKVHLPSKPIVGMLRFFEQIHIPFPIKAEQVLRLGENKEFSYVEAQNDFGFSPFSFEEGLKLELTQMQTG